MELFDVPIYEVYNEELERRFDDREQKDRVVTALYDWLVNSTRKKPVPDLATRLEKMHAEFEHMVEDMKVKVQEGKLVVKVAGSAEDTLQKVRRGTDWFEGSEDALEIILTGLFDE